MATLTSYEFATLLKINHGLPVKEEGAAAGEIKMLGKFDLIRRAFNSDGFEMTEKGHQLIRKIETITF
jgi:hypothetical protein